MKLTFSAHIRHAAKVALAIVLCAFGLVLFVSCGSVRDVPVATDADAGVADAAPFIGCPPAAIAPEQWQTVVDDTGTYELRLPPGFEAVAAEKGAFLHGGQAWKRGPATISIAFGHWAEYSFDDEAGERCRVYVGDANVFVIVGARSVLAWHDRGSGHEPVVTVFSTDEAEVVMLAPVVLSLRRR